MSTASIHRLQKADTSATRNDQSVGGLGVPYAMPFTRDSWGAHLPGIEILSVSWIGDNSNLR